MIALAGAIVLGLLQVRPVGAATIERMPGKILITSKRMHADTVRLTITVAVYSSGNVEVRYDVHNGVRLGTISHVGGRTGPWPGHFGARPPNVGRGPTR